MKSLTPSDAKALSEVFDKILDKDVHHATKYISPTHIVRATRSKNNRTGNLQVTVTVGKPNFDEREFVSLCKKAGEKFPIRNVQLKFHPVQKEKKK